jgi:hypothetical protein
MNPSASMEEKKISSPTGFRTLDCPIRSESLLYRLRLLGAVLDHHAATLATYDHILVTLV